MKLFNKTIDTKLFKQYPIGSDLSKQKVVAKIFNPQGSQSWYIINSDPSDPDYLWAIVDFGQGAEVGSVSRYELENYKGKFGLGFERDLYFSDTNAEELYNGLLNGKNYSTGGGFAYKKGGSVEDFYGVKTLGKKVKDDKGLLYWKNEKDGKIRLTSDNGTMYFVEFDSLKDAEDYVKKINAKTPNFFSSTFEEGGEINAFTLRMVKGTNSNPDEVRTEERNIQFKSGGALGRSKDRRFLNHSQDHEVRYSKGKNRHGYGKSVFSYGGALENKIKAKLSQNFSLPMEVVVYVPSTQDADKTISKIQFKSRIKEVETYLSKLFGGFSASDVEGGYMSNNKSLITEDVFKVVSFAPREDFEVKVNTLVNQVKKWAEKWGQESIGLEFEGDLFYIEASAKFVKGGATEEDREDYLEKIQEEENDVWEDLKITSGAQIRTNKKVLKEYAEKLEVKIKKLGVKRNSLTREDYDFFTDNNWHLLNDFLVWNNYYTAEVSKEEKKWRNETSKDFKDSSYWADPETITVTKNEPTKTMKEKREEYLKGLLFDESEVWDKIGASSGGEIRKDKELLKKYALGVFKAFETLGVALGSFDQADYDYFENQNAHLFNEFLVWNNYYEPIITKKEQAWRLVDSKNPEYSSYIADPETITLNTTKRSNNSSKKYIVHADIKSVTVTKSGKEQTYLGKDVLNGANILEGGGKLEKDASYFSKNNIVSVELKDGSIVHPANGYWIKKEAKPINAEEEKPKLEGYTDLSKVVPSKIETSETTAMGNPDKLILSFERKKIAQFYFNMRGYNQDFFLKNKEGNSFGFQGDKAKGKQVTEFKKALKDGYVFIKSYNKETGGTLDEFKGGGRVTFDEKSSAIAKNFVGKKVEPKYQKDYGKTYDKKEAEEVGDKIAGSMVAKEKMATGGAVRKGNPKMKQAIDLAKKIQQPNEKWTNAVKRAWAELK